METTHSLTDGTYEFRSFEKGDRTEFLSLYETVFEKSPGSEWFEWKYVANPYIDHVPILVAERAGSIVGCRSFFALELSINGSIRPALQPCDTMVHPNHRNRGLFSRLNELAIERYSNRETVCFFNFPNDQSRSGNLKHGWQEIGTVPLYYRARSPVAAINETATDSERTQTIPEWLVPPGLLEESKARLSGLTTTAHRTADRLITSASTIERIQRYQEPPVEVLESIYRRSIPDNIHTARTASFYRWRLANPARTYISYVAWRHDTPVAALIVSVLDDRLQIIDTIPREIHSERSTLERLLVTACSDNADHSVATAFGHTLPTPIRYRFLPDVRFPLSFITRPSSRTLLARDLDSEGGIETTTTADWALSRLDLDTT